MTYQSVHQMKWQPKTLVVIQAELKQLAQKYVPEKDMVSVQNFLEIKSYYPQVLAKLTASSQEQSSLGSESTKRTRQKIQKLVFYMPRMFEDRKQWEWNYGNKRRNKESRLKYLKSHWKQSFYQGDNLRSDS